jgi:hypothetical protein
MMIRLSAVAAVAATLALLAAPGARAPGANTPSLSSTQEDTSAGDPHGAIRSLGGMGSAGTPQTGVVVTVPKVETGGEGPDRTGGAPMGTSTRAR